MRRSSHVWAAYWIVFSVFVALANVWVALILSLRQSLPWYRIALSDGTGYVFTVVLVATSSGAYIYEMTRTPTSRPDIAPSAWASLLVISGLLFLGGGALVLYTQTILARLDGRPITIEADLPYLLAMVVGAILYGFRCESLTRRLRVR